MLVRYVVSSLNFHWMHTAGTGHLTVGSGETIRTEAFICCFFKDAGPTILASGIIT